MEIKIVRLDNDTIPANPTPEPVLYVLKTGGYVIKCHGCGKNGFLNHEVIWNGDKVTVNPSLICPHCENHYWIKDGYVC